MYNYGYGAPPPYVAPSAYTPPAYGAPTPAYGAPPAPYGAPPALYGAPPPPYSAPTTTYGAPPYGSQAPPYGAVASAYGAAPPGGAATPQSSSSAAPASTNLQSGHSASTLPPPSQQQQQQPAQALAAQGTSYPSLTASPPPETVPAYSNSHATNSGSQRPVSAYPTIGSSTSYSVTAGPNPSADDRARPSSASPATAAAAYGTAHGATPYNPQQPTAPFTYGQPAAAGVASHFQSAGSYTSSAAATAPSYMPPTTYTPAPGHGSRRRRAVLIGCSYAGSSAALNGCLNDVQCIQFCLQKRFGFSEQEIVVLRDDPGRHRDFTSTKANIYRSIQWLMMDQRHGDSLFFHFSGHGSQQVDRNGDEEDGYDETICPSDFRHAGQIVDDELNRLLVRPLMPGVTLHAVIDACHSGTALDLTFRAKVDTGGRWYWKGRPRYDKATMGGTAFQFGACKDSQVAQDTKVLSGNAYTGAATFCFIQAIEKYGVNQTYGQILNHMMSALRTATGTPGINLGSTGSLIAGLLLGSSASLLTSGGQTPVLSCDKQVDLYSAKLTL